jgi:hypothetical protein
MWKYVVGFLILAGGLVWLMSISDAPIDMSGEKHEIPATAGHEKEAPKKP